MPSSDDLSRNAERSPGRAEGLRQAQRPHQRAMVDLNRASVRTLAQLASMGPVRARQIVEYRDRHGPFHHVDELACLPHFDRELVEKLRDLLKV